MEQSWNGQRPGCDDCLVWQGTFLLHPEEKITAVERVRRMIERALAHTNNVTVIAHSQGAELTYAALQQQSRNGTRSTVRNLITLGSYLSTTRTWHPSRRFSVAHLGLTGQWINVHAEGDPIGASISDPSVVDVRLGRASDVGPGATATGFHLTRQHAWPYRDPVTITMAERVVTGDLRGSNAILAHYAQAGSTVNRSLMARAGSILADPFRFVADGVSAGLGLFGSASSPTPALEGGAE
jgi:formamidopyrimidine-DNA glycosylase